MARRDQERELCVATTWLLHVHRHAARLLENERDLELAFQALIGGAHCVAAAEVIASGEIHEGLAIHRALVLAPELMREVYLDVLTSPRTGENLGKTLRTLDAYLEENAEARLRPVLRYLRKEKRLELVNELSTLLQNLQDSTAMHRRLCESNSRMKLINRSTTTPVQSLLWRLNIHLILILLVARTLAFSGWGGEWPAWRGPSAVGIATDNHLPLAWSTNENVRWRVPLPEPGNSTPVIWGQRVFVTQAIENRRTVMCFDRTTGKLLWQQGPTYSGSESTHETNPRGSSSPVTDGERVVAWFGSAGLYCYDFAGRELWHRDLGSQKHIWGSGSSPVLSSNLCYLNFGPGEPSFLIAVDKKTGREVWRVNEPNADSGEKKPGKDQPTWAGSWSTPIVIMAGHREELVLSWPKRVQAFDPKTGQELWYCSGLNPLVYTSPIYDEESEIIVAMGGYMGMALAVKAGGSGDVTEARRLWHHPKTRQRIGSGVIHQDHVYILNDPGIAECFQLQTGKLIWEERLRGPAPKSDSWSSMVAADGKLYVVNQGGDAFVLRASPRFEVLATNSLAETTISSPAVSNDQLYIRTHQALWCIGEPGR